MDSITIQFKKWLQLLLILGYSFYILIGVIILVIGIQDGSIVFTIVGSG